MNPENWIATEAKVAHETATKYLKRLADDSKLNADTRGQQTMYEPDPVGQYLIEMRELYEEHSPDALAASLGRTEGVSDERERRQAVREWDHLKTRRRLVEDALRLYDRFLGERRSASA